MGYSPFTLTHHRDPRLLWPLLGLASVVVHGLLLGVLGAVRLEVRPLAGRSGSPIPVQLMTEAEGGAVGLAPSPDVPLGEIAPDTAAPPWEGSAEDTDSTAVPAEALPAEPSSALEGLPLASDVSPVDVPAGGPSGAESSQPGSFDPPSELPAAPAGYAAPGMGSAGGSGTGQLVPLGIRVDPNGRDLPDTLPQLQSSSSIWIQPFLPNCGQDNASLANVSATVQMRITVEVDGRISHAEVTQSSGDAALDALATCLVPQGLQMVPATTAGVQRPTDAVLLEARLQL